jgi:hypothetical protein
MKTFFAIAMLVMSLSGFASENQGSECTRTLHSDERENSKASDQDRTETRESASAVGA